MESKTRLVDYRCTCGFRLDKVPREVVDDLPRCLGCGRELRSSSRVGVRSVTRVRDLR
jgi:hypothetical protein